MGKLVVVVGNTGVGKTTLVRMLGQRLPLALGLEQHIERPFQKLFSLDLPRYALPNQVDYLLYRGEQELAVRRSLQTGLLDGGLDLDYHVFTRHFSQKGYLAEGEFDLCRRMYTLLRELLPPPELIIWLDAPQDVIAERYRRRNRALEIAALQDLHTLDHLLHEWLEGAGADGRVLKIDAGVDDPGFAHVMDCVIEAISE